MSGGSQDGSRFPVVGLIAIMAVTGGLFVFKPLHSSRPIDMAKNELPAIGGIEARLWEDPLVAVQRHIASLDNGDVSPVNQAAIMDLPATLSNSNIRVLFLPVMIPDERNAISHEHRIRSRYAVLSALGVNGYYPEDPNHIQYFEWSRGTDKSETEKCFQKDDLKSGSNIAKVIPYEICSGESGKVDFDKVVVLWLPDSFFESEPIKKLRCLKTKILKMVKNNPKVLFQLVGPSRSDILQEMLNAESDSLGFNIFSPWSTVHPSLLTSGKDSKFEFQEDRECWVFHPDPTKTPGDQNNVEGAETHEGEAEKNFIQRTIPNDLALLKLIVKELELRGVHLNLDSRETTAAGTGSSKGGDSVLIISEWDRSYGRSMPATFEAAWRIVQHEKGEVCLEKGINIAHRETVGEILKKARKGPLSPAIFHLSYMQGLDGLSILSPVSSEKATGTAKEGKKETARPPSRPYGPGQLDYIRRLAGELRQYKTQKNVKAIGLLGGDVFDKLLLMQALRDIYPGVLFFTTDLDAILLQSSEQKWARNLIVASGYGLEVKDRESQPHLAPFRGTYMHSMFLATDGAVRQKANFDKMEPKLFEIGRTRAVQLVPQFDSGKKSLGIWLLNLGRIALAVGGLLFLISRLRCDFRMGSLKRSLWSLLLPPTVLLVVITILGLTWPTNNIPQEPVLFFEGVSIWPTEMVRIFAAILAIYFLVQTVFALGESRNYLTERFELRDIKEEGRTGWEKVKSLLCFVFRTWPASRAGNPEIDKVWGNYLRLGRARNRAGRVAVLFGMYFILSLLIFKIFGRPLVPFRGMFSLKADIAILWMSVVLMLVLVFFVVDATLLCRRFIQIISAKRSNWPESSLNMAKRERGLEPDLAVEWLDIAIIERRTRTVGRFVVYPFIILFLMIISRNSFFDRWSWPISLVLVLGLNSTFAIMSAVIMRRAAEQARARSLNRLRSLKYIYQGQGEQTRADQADDLMQEITLLRGGSFAPLSQNPLFGAIIMPFGGISLAVLLEMLSGVG